MTIEEAKRLLNQHQIVPATWDKHTDQRLQRLHPLLRVIFALAVNDCYLKGYKVRLTTDGNLRTFDEQNYLYGSGKTAEQLKAVGLDAKYANPSGTWKSNATAGESYHNYGLAADVCLISVDGKTADFKLNADTVMIFKTYGFEWGGDWQGNKKDTPHFQMTFGLSVKDLYKKYMAHEVDSDGYVKVQ